MIPKRKAAVDVPARLAVFEPSEWANVFEWAEARRKHLAPLAVTAPGRWIDTVAESHRTVAAVLLRGELG